MLAIVLFIALFLFSLWFTGFIAKALGAQRPGILWVFLVFVAMVVIQILLGFTPLVQYPILLLVLLLLLATVVYAKILDMSYVYGFLTMLVSSIVTVLLAVGITLVVGFNLPGVRDFMAMTPSEIEGDVTLDTVARAAESVCQCESDKQCLGDKSREFGQIMAMFSVANPSPVNQAKLQKYTERVLLCSVKPGPYDISKAVIKQKPKSQATPIFEAEEIANAANVTGTAALETDSDILLETDITTAVTTPEVASETTTVAEEISIPSYQIISLAEAGNHTGRPVRVSRKSGKQLEGKLTSVGAGRLVIEQRRYGGIFSFPLKTSDVKQLEAFF